MRKTVVFVGMFGFFAALSSSPVLADFVINATFDKAWQAENLASKGVLDADVQSAIKTYESLFSNNVTINIEFKWGGVGTDKGSGTGAAATPTYGLAGAYLHGLSLDATEQLFKTHAKAHPENKAINTAVHFLPASLPNPGGVATFNVGNPEYEALTATASTHLDSGVIDGVVGFGTKSTSTFWTAFALHEISHVMGRTDYAFASKDGKGGNPPTLTPLDFFKYTTGTKTLDPTFSKTSFSINGGKTDLETFSNVSDSSDWLGTNKKDPYDAFGNGDATLTKVDITEMHALGWDPKSNAVPEPSSFALLGLGGVGLAIGAYRRRRAAAV